MLSYLTDAYYNFIEFIVKKPKKIASNKSGKNSI